MKVGGFCCQVPPGTPPYGANRKDFKADHLTALSSEASLSIVVISNYYKWTGIGGTPPSESHCLYYARRSCFAPAKLLGQSQDDLGQGEEFGGGAGHCPRVRNAYSVRRLSP